MLQSVATLISVFLVTGMIAVIVAILADDWAAVAQALGRHTQPIHQNSRARTRSSGDRRARVIRLSAQSAPLRAAA